MAVNGAAAGCTSMWQCRLEFQHSRIEALEESFSKNAAWTFQAQTNSKMSLSSIYEASCMQWHKRNRRFYASLCKITAPLVFFLRHAEIKNTIFSISSDAHRRLPTSFTDTVTRVPAMTGNAISPHPSSVAVHASPARAAAGSPAGPTRVSSANVTAFSLKDAFVDICKQHVSSSHGSIHAHLSPHEGNSADDGNENLNIYRLGLQTYHHVRWLKSTAICCS